MLARTCSAPAVLLGLSLLFWATPLHAATRSELPPLPAVEHRTGASPASPADARRAGARVVRSSRSATWDGLGRVEVVMVDEGVGTARHRSTGMVLLGPPGAQRLLHTAEWPFATIDRLEDVDGDGALDLVISVDTGFPCWTCHWVEVFRLTPGGVQAIVPPERFQSLEDVDGDGRAEAIAVDPRWEFFEGLARSFSPRLEIVHRRVAGAWVEDPAASAILHRRRLAALGTRLSQLGRTTPRGWDDETVGTIVACLIHRVALGEKQAAWIEAKARIEDRRRALARGEDEAQDRFTSLLAALRRDLGLP